MGQFARKTGLHRDSIGRAVESLVRLGLIRVESAEGDLLDTPALRKRYGARLYYRLADRNEPTPDE
jgi:DNA-binding IclR family transcriptional regulator